MISTQQTATDRDGCGHGDGPRDAVEDGGQVSQRLEPAQGGDPERETSAERRGMRRGHTSTWRELSLCPAPDSGSQEEAG